MHRVSTCPIPQKALLQRYRKAHHHTDSYVGLINKKINQAQYIDAFYTTRLFKLERWILNWAVSKPSTDAQARALAQGKLDKFSAWQVEKRSENQLLMCDFQSRTRSWLMVEPQEGGARTRLFFGSAVIPVANKKTGELGLGLIYRGLLGFHKIYSILLLKSAIRRLNTQIS